MTGVQTSASLFRRTANDIGIQLQVTVLIPAYNEEQAIIRVLEEVSAVMESTNYRYEVLVVDDASTDATAQLAEEFSVTCWESPVRHGDWFKPDDSNGSRHFAPKVSASPS